MRFLIICSYYPPDTAVAAVRPYMLAKYISLQGHSVTVLRSGDFYKMPDTSYKQLEQVKVISFLGPDSDAERFERGEKTSDSDNKLANHAASLPQFLYKPLFVLYSTLTGPFKDLKRLKTSEKHFALQRNAIDKLFEDGYEFDVIFSTYNLLENIYAGEYAAEKFNAKWVQDFRDPVTEYYRHGSFYWNIGAKKIQKYVLNKADICTAVSKGLAQDLIKTSSGSCVEVIYNGYDNVDDSRSSVVSGDKLVLCYTGQVYEASLKALELMLRHIQVLVNNNMISLEKLKIIYAGSDSLKIASVFRKFNLSSVLEDHGYVSRTQAYALQKQSDAFIVLSWNTKRLQGVLTGKFYEGIRADKSIISIVTGNKPNSELQILNSKYNYGFCLEQCSDKQHGAKFEEYLLKIYNEKINNGFLSYQTSDELKKTFRYDCIASDLIKKIVK